ncbi:hypothetical protein JCM10449v2_005069 [Rhodotorula kratochvilovae]
MHHRIFRPAPIAGNLGLAGVRSHAGLAPLRQDHSTIGVASDSEEDWTHADEEPHSPGWHHLDEQHEDFDEIAPTDVDPLRELPALVVIEAFEDLAEECSHAALMGEEEIALCSTIRRQLLPLFDRHLARAAHQGHLTPRAIYDAFLYWASDSGRVHPSERMYFGSWALQHEEKALPRWRTQEDQETGDIVPRTWGEAVDALEWYRMYEVIHYRNNWKMRRVDPQPEPALGRFRLEDPVDPVDALLLMHVFQHTLSHVHENSTDASIKFELETSWEVAYPAFIHALRADARASAAPPSHDDEIDDARPRSSSRSSGDLATFSFSPILELQAPPAPTALYRAFLFFAHGPPRAQRDRHLRRLPPGEVNTWWVSRCRAVFGLGAAALAAERAREKNAWQGVSWREWKRRVGAQLDMRESAHHAARSRSRSRGRNGEDDDFEIL